MRALSTLRSRIGYSRETHSVTGVRVMGIDPGGTTGICIIAEHKIEWADELHSLAAVVQCIVKRRPDLIVLEDYLGSRPGRNYRDPVTVIGAVQAIAHLLAIPVVLQVPSDQERFRDTLRKAHRSPHVRSALAHVAFYLAS